MKLKLSIQSMIRGCSRSKVIEIDDDDISDLSDEERNEYFDELAADYLHEQIDHGWEIVE